MLYRKLCDDIIGKFTITNGVSESNENKILDKPVQLSAKAAEMENKDEVIKSVWMVEREDVSVSFQCYSFRIILLS